MSTRCSLPSYRILKTFLLELKLCLTFFFASSFFLCLVFFYRIFQSVEKTFLHLRPKRTSKYIQKGTSKKLHDTTEVFVSTCQEKPFVQAKWLIAFRITEMYNSLMAIPKETLSVCVCVLVCVRMFACVFVCVEGEKCLSAWWRVKRSPFIIFFPFSQSIHPFQMPCHIMWIRTQCVH